MLNPSAETLNLVVEKEVRGRRENTRKSSI
jgi:hypothetical protein